MNKKFKLAIPFAVLALTCGIAAGCDGCGGGDDGGHTHDYSAWGHNETQHWKECPEDHERDESTVEDHVFVAGECECGATEQTGPIEQAKYGTVTGKIKLVKQGIVVTDAAVLNSISVDMGDDKVEITSSVSDGVYAFTVTNVKVGTSYDLSITCTGYESYSTGILLEEENEEAKIGGANGIALNYEVFGLLAGYDGSYHDFSQVNENVIRFLENDGSKTLNVLTKDSYNDVSASLNIKYNNSTHNMHTQGIVLRFEDGKHVIVRYHNGDQKNGNIQYVDQALDPCKKEDTLFGNDAGLDQWGEAKIHTLLDAETAAIKSDGLDLNVVLKDGTLYSFFDGKFIAKYALPEGYAEKKVQVGYFAWNAASNAVFNYEITETVPESMTTTLDINVTRPEGVTGCEVTATPEKQTYEFGEQIELAFTAPEGYKLETLTIGGDDKLKAVMNGKLTIIADRPTIEISATYAAEEPIALNLTVKGKKLGTTAALAKDTVVKFKGTDYSFTVGENGVISASSVVKGSYTIVVDGYQEKEIEFNEELKEITLEYDTFKEILGWGDFDFTKQNEATPEFGITNDCGVIFTNETYGDVKTSIYLKGKNMNAGNGGLLFRFIGEGFADNGETVNLTMQGTKKVQFSQGDLWGKTTVATGCVWNNLYYFEDCHDDEADRTAGANAAKYLEEYAAGMLKLSVIRRGATFYVFLDDTLIGQLTVDAKYENAKCEVGFLTSDLGNTTDWKSWKVEISDDVALASYSITDETAADAHGRISGIPAEKIEAGATVTLTVVAEEGYKLSSLTVNGINVTAQMQGSTYDLVVTGDTTVVAEFAQIVPGSVNAVINGKKLGTTAPLAEGTQVTLTCQGLEDITSQITAEGLVIDSIPAGVWTVNVQGYFPVQITVENETVYSQAITLEYDLFKIVRWDADGHGLTHVNDEKPYVEWNGPGASLNAVSKECWLDDATVSVTIKSSLTKNGENQQGLVLRFEDGKAAILNINTSDPLRLQFRPELFSDANDATIGLHTAFAEDWVEFKNLTADEVAKYNTEEGIVLKVARKGNLLHVYIDDTYHGTATLPEKYADDKMGFGLFSFDAVTGAKWYFNVSETLPELAVTVTDETAADAHGTIAISENISLGGTVTITVTPANGYMLDTITVSGGVTLTAAGNNTYTFVATERAYTVSATFKDAPAIEAESDVSGIGLGALEIDMNGKYITFRSAGGAEATLEVTDGKVKGVLAAGEYTVSCEGFYDLTATVEADGSFAENTSLTFNKIIFTTNGINEPTNNIFVDKPVSWSADDTYAASQGIIKSVSAGKIYEWSVDEYRDVAITVTLKSGNGNQGLIMRFGGQQKDVRLRFENTKAQWIGGGWWWGTHHINDRWDFGSGEDYANPMNEALLTKYNGEGLTLTLARKGGMVYAIIDGKIYAAQSVSEFAGANVRLAVFVENAVEGYNIPFVIEETDDVLNRAGVAVGTDLIAYGGTWTEDSAAKTLQVSGRGYAEFKAEANTVKESVTIKIKGDVGGDQGIMYRFADGKYIAVRYQYNGGSYKVQYTMDTVLFNDGSLKDWTDFLMTDEEKAAFDSSGLDLTFIRDGATFYTYLGDRLLDTAQLEDKYAEMSGAMGIMIWEGEDVAFTYEHKTGENVTVPTTPAA